MIFQESETVELKEVILDDIKKEIIAFANCNGGKLYVGVRVTGQWQVLKIRTMLPYRSAIWCVTRSNQI